MQVHVIPSHENLGDMPSATNNDHNGKYLQLDQTTPETIINGVPLMTTAVDGEGSGSQLVNMDFVNLAVSSLKLSEFFHDDADVLGGLYFIMDETEDTAGTVVSAGVPSGAAVNIFNFLTPDGKPGLDRLVEGFYSCHAHISRSASITRDVTVHYELYKRQGIAQGTTETLLGASEVQAITTSVTEYDIHLALSAEEMILTTDRLLIKWYATVTGAGGANPTVTMTTGGEENSHFAVNVNALGLSTIYVSHSLATAVNDFLVASGAGAFVKKTLAETGAILEDDIEHDNLQSIPANEHIDHTGVTLTAGDGLSGGGDISANRSFAVDLNELGTEATIASGDFIAMVDITDSGSEKITFANFEKTISHSGIADVGTGSDHSLLSATAGIAEALKAVIVDANLALDMLFGDRINPGAIDGRPAKAAITDLNPISLYTFDDTLAGVGSGSPPTLTKTAGTIEYIDRGIGKAVCFDSSTYYTADTPSFEGVLGTAARTSMAMIKGTTVGQQVISSYGSDVAGQYWAFNITGGSSPMSLIVATSEGNGTSNTDARLTDGEWHLVCAVHEAGNDMDEIIFYIDGDNVGQLSGTATQVDTDTGEDYTIGALTSTGGSKFDGDMGMVAEFDVALTQAQIQGIYKALKTNIVGGSSVHSIDWTDADTDFKTSGEVTADTGFTVGASVGQNVSWVNAEGDTVVVQGGIITSVSP